MEQPFSDLWRAQGSPAAHALWDMVAGPMPRGVLGVGDPDVHYIDGRWTMLLGGFSATFRNRLYRCTLADGGRLSSGPWVFDIDHRGRTAALTPDPPRNAWDAGGMHTPSYVPAADGHGERVYYTGRMTAKQYGSASRYAIGVLERRSGEWVRQRSPVVVGDEHRGSALEPVVLHTGDRYRMWYLANPHEIGPGEQPNYQLRCTESANGRTDWTPPTVFADTAEGFFDNALVRRGNQWIMLLARGSNLHGTPDFPAQGLWWMTAAQPGADRGEWSEPQRLLDTDAAGTPAWFGRGTYGPALAFADPASTRASVFFTGTRLAPKWPRLAMRRLAALQRPPVPAPFYLATGAIELDLS